MKVKYGSSLKFISESAFRYCYKLKNVELSDSVEEIGKDAFCSCTALQYVKLSKNLIIGKANITELF